MSIKMTKEQKDRIIDYFEPWELVQLLGITMEDIVEDYEEQILEALDDLEDIMGVKHV